MLANCYASHGQVKPNLNSLFILFSSSIHITFTLLSFTQIYIYLFMLLSIFHLHFLNFSYHSSFLTSPITFYIYYIRIQILPDPYLLSLFLSLYLILSHTSISTLYAQSCYRNYYTIYSSIFTIDSTFRLLMSLYYLTAQAHTYLSPHSYLVCFLPSL